MRVFMHARRLIVAGSAVVGLAATGLPAAHAAAQPPSLWSAFASPVLAPGTPGKTFQHQIGGSAATPTTFTGVTVTYDVSGLAGVATLTPQSGKCSTSGTRITCHVGSFSAVQIGGGPSTAPYSGAEYLPVKLTPTAAAVAGATGTVAATVSANSVAASSSTITVSLADGPDLQFNTPTPSFQAVPVGAGSAYYRAVKFTNVGNRAALGVTVEIEADGYGLDVPEVHDNCQYSASSTAYCYIPDRVAPGATETLSPTIEVLTTTDLMWEGLRITVVPGYAALPIHTVGTGKPFVLKDASGAAQNPVTGQTTQTNLDYFDSVAYLDLRVDGAAADIAATADIYWSDPGQYQLALVPFNNGPGYIQLGRSGDLTVTGDVLFPAGVTVTNVPNNWQQVANSTPGVTEYQFNAGNHIPTGSGIYGGSVPIVVPQPGFAGGDGTFTVGINNQPATAFANAGIGNVDTDPSNDTTTFAIPAYGS